MTYQIHKGMFFRLFKLNEEDWDLISEPVTHPDIVARVTLTPKRKQDEPKQEANTAS